MGHIIMEAVKNKRFNYTTPPIVEWPRVKTVQTHKNVSEIAPPKRVLSNPSQIADNNDKAQQKADLGRKGKFSNWCKFNGYISKSLQIISENQKISENVDFNKHQVD
jgi:hypothetical protein